MRSNTLHQLKLVQQLRILFPNDKVITNSRKESNLKLATSGSYLELDAWLPSLDLAFEFQDVYHYVTTWYSHNSQEIIQKKDYIKRMIAQQQETTLVFIPCWWDGSSESLSATINCQRPDLITGRDEALEISLNPPPHFFESPLIPGIGEVMAASFPTDPKFIDSFSPNSWWIGEKYDGIRCCWNSDQSLIYLSPLTSKLLPILPQFVNSMPDIFIDAELWFGRGFYLFTYPLINDASVMVQWHLLRITAFDSPHIDDRSKPFEERYTMLLDNIDIINPVTIVATRILAKNKLHLNSAVQHVIDDGGEGVILRKIESLYVPGRSSSLLKLKTTYGDKEGIVVAKGKDSVQLKLPNGKIFSVPTSSVFIPTLHVGDIVTFSYENHARRDLPVNPKIYRIRTDLDWQEVINNFKKEETFLSEKEHLQGSGFKTQPVNYWNAKKMKEYLENFAKQRGMDPLAADTWYKLPYSAISQFKNVLHKFKGFFNTLQFLFPDIKLDILNFPRPPWSLMDTRRKFFENYAKDHSFDPHVPDCWYSQSIDSILQIKGAKNIIQYHGGSVSRALIDLFPNIGLDKSKLWSQWGSANMRRKFFEEYAKMKEFDPRVHYHWYTQSRQEILSTDGAIAVISYHKNSLSRALLDLFPNIGLDKMRLWYNSAWKDKHKRRKFFEDFAKKKGFDPRVAQNWYSSSVESLLNEKETLKVLYYHNRSVVQALMDLFPDIGLEKSKIWAYWHNIKNRKAFFNNYAEAHKFDPSEADHWYKQYKDDIYNFEGALSVMSFHRGSISRALIELFPNTKFDKSKLKFPSFWSERRNRITFFEKYAKMSGFDPNLAENWYLRIDDLLNQKETEKLIGYHNGSVEEALIDLFPNIGLQMSKFQSRKYQISDEKYERLFFESYAREKEFNPHNPDNWYNQPIDQIMSFKGAERVMEKYDYSISKALLNSLPEIGLYFSKFSFLMHDASGWKGVRERKRFFERYAKENNFDSKVAEHWYSQSTNQIVSFKGASSVLKHYNNSIIKALLDVYPDIGLEKSKFRFIGSWSEIGRRRQFFIDFSKNNNFDYRSPDAWYTQSFDSILIQKGASRMIAHHNYSIIRALCDLFPEIKFDKFKFWAQSSKNRRKFFEKYAKENGITTNDPQSWYSHPIHKIHDVEGMKTILEQHGNSVKQALIDLFPNIGFVESKFWDKWRFKETLRDYFISFSKENDFNFSDSNNWYSFYNKLVNTPEYDDIIAQHNSLQEALSIAFPNIVFDPSKLKPARWEDKKARRKHFITWAEEKQFDPFIAENWYLHFKLKLSSTGDIILKKYYGGSIINALMDLFPDVGLQEFKFPINNVSWGDKIARRSFFENYAKNNNFDPLNAKEWYLQPRERILASKGGHGVIHYHGGSISQALFDLFPNINFNLLTYWARVSKNRKAFFLKYAEENKFDPLEPNHWYKLDPKSILSLKETPSILYYHQGSGVQALIELFPNLLLKKKKFLQAW